MARLFEGADLLVAPNCLDWKLMVVVVLPDPFRGVGAWRNSTETQQSGHPPRSGSEVKNGRSGAEDGAPERLGCGTSPSIREVGRNGETTTSRGTTIRSPPIDWRLIASTFSFFFTQTIMTDVTNTFWHCLNFKIIKWKSFLIEQVPLASLKICL